MRRSRNIKRSNSHVQYSLQWHLKELTRVINRVFLYSCLPELLNVHPSRDDFHSIPAFSEIPAKREIKTEAEELESACSIYVKSYPDKMDWYVIKPTLFKYYHLIT